MAEIKKPVATVKKDVTSAVATAKVETPAPAATAAPVAKKEEAKPAAKKATTKKK